VAATGIGDSSRKWNVQDTKFYGNPLRARRITAICETDVVTALTPTWQNDQFLKCPSAKTQYVSQATLFAGRKNHSNTHNNDGLTRTFQFQHLYSILSSDRTARLPFTRNERTGSYVSCTIQFLRKSQGNNQQRKPHYLRNPATLTQQQLYSAVHIFETWWVGIAQSV
jgi:hypothetical protein